MTEPQPAAASVNGESDAAFADLFEELAERVRRGEDPEAVAGEFPTYAGRLRRLLPAVRLVAEMGSAPGSGDLAFVPGAGRDAGPGQLGDFRLIREVGRGGMGVVYEAEQISLGRRVALKTLPFVPSTDPRLLKRFQNEARAAAALDHPHVVKIHGIGQERGVHYIAMQFIDGRPLSDLIRVLHGPADEASPDAATAADDPVPTSPAAHQTTVPEARTAPFFRRAARLGIQAAKALEHAHGLGVVHRDVKPGNLIVDAGGDLWVADFGLAKFGAGAGLTMSGDLVGTLRYMSPEQALARHGLVDHRSDVYALGATLYELLTGRPVVAAEDKKEILRRIAFDDPIAPRRLNRAVPTDLETIVLKAIEKDPADRYATAEEVAEDLRRFLDGEPVCARRPTVARRASRWARRHQAVVATAMAALVVFSVGMGVAVGQVSAAKRDAEEREAETRAVLDFVENKILAAARPEGVGGGLGHDVTLRRAVQAALPFVEESFQDQPLIEARLRMTLGLSFRHLGEELLAAQQFQAAHALYAKFRGADHSDTLRSISKLANSYAGLGQNADALGLHAATLAQRQATLGPDHPDTLASMNNLGITYDAVGQHDKALELHKEALTLRQARFGSDHPDVLESMNNLANSYSILGRHSEAVGLREKTLALQKARPVPDTEAVLAGMNNLAESYQALGRHADALRLFEQTLTLAKTKLPPDHPKTHLVMNNLAWLLATADDTRFRDTKRAVELAEQAARLSPMNAEFVGTLGTARYRAGQWKEAAADLEAATRLRGADSPRNANESFFLAMACWRLGEPARARDWFNQGTGWMNTCKSRDDEVRRFRAEAAELLGIKAETPGPDRQTAR